MAAEDETGVEKKKGGEEKIDFRAGEDEGNDTIADGAENGAEAFLTPTCSTNFLN